MVDKNKSILTLCKQQENNVSSFDGYVHSYYKSNIEDGCLRLENIKRCRFFTQYK